MILARLFVLILLLSAYGPAQAQRVTSLALDTGWHGLPQVSVTLNGSVDAHFVIDTAASKTIVSGATMGRLGLSDPGEPARLSGSTGQGSVHRFTLASLRIGAREYRGLRAFTLPHLTRSAPIDGLIGADILRDYVVEFDLPRGRARLFGQHDEIVRDERDWILVPFSERADGLLILAVSIGPLRVPALFDTGATQSIMNHATARELGLHLFPDSASREAIGGASGHVQQMHQINISRFSLGEFTVERSSMGVADLAIFDTLEIGDRPAVLLSAAALSGRRFIIDYPRDRLLIARNPV